MQNKSLPVGASRGLPSIPVIDLFAGPGGLGEGFSAPRETGGTGRFHIALSVEMDSTAHQTLELRALFRQFPYGSAPAEYYRFIRGDIDRATLFNGRSVGAAARKARQEAWHFELGSTDHRTVRDRVLDALAGAKESVLIGGPPCQAYSLVGRSRNRGNPNYDAAEDGRHHLYREYLKVLAVHWPAVFVMENVKGLLSARLDEESIFDRVVRDLRDPSRAVLGKSARSASHRYELFALSGEEGDLQLIGPSSDPRRFIVRCENLGIPQARHRIIVLGVRRDYVRQGIPQLLRSRPLATECAIGDLQPLRSGLSRTADSFAGWHSTLSSSVKDRWFLRLSHGGKVEQAIASRIDEAINTAFRGMYTRGDGGSPYSAPRIHREWYVDRRLDRTSNHTSRAHMREDVKRYLYAAAFAEVTGVSPHLRDFPSELLPKHRNILADADGAIFGDRFRVQVRDRPSTTVTSHIAKDGHYYIHYDTAQARSLTAREAARLQTFPDNYFFCGGRTAQYHQIGNAVPPLLARHIAHVVAAILS